MFFSLGEFLLQTIEGFLRLVKWVYIENENKKSVLEKEQNHTDRAFCCFADQTHVHIYLFSLGVFFVCNYLIYLFFVYILAASHT